MRTSACHACDHAVGAALTIASVGTATSPLRASGDHADAGGCSRRAIAPLRKHSRGAYGGGARRIADVAQVARESGRSRGVSLRPTPTASPWSPSTPTALALSALSGGGCAGRGAPTSPGLFTNAAQPIARATARNRAIAHTARPVTRSDPSRSSPARHPRSRHRAAAHTTGCELLDVPRYDHHSGPRRKRPQFAITKIVFSPATRTRPSPRTSAGSRATGSKPPRTPSCCIAVKHASERFATDSFPGASDRQPPSPDTELACPSPTIGKGTRACRYRPRPRIGGWRQRPPLRSGRGPDGEHGQHHGRTTQRRNPTAARHVRGHCPRSQTRRRVDRRAPGGGSR